MSKEYDEFEKEYMWLTCGAGYEVPDEEEIREEYKKYILGKIHPTCRKCCKLDTTCIGLDANAEDKQMISCYLSGPTKNTN